MLLPAEQKYFPCFCDPSASPEHSVTNGHLENHVLCMHSTQIQHSICRGPITAATPVLTFQLAFKNHFSLPLDNYRFHILTFMVYFQNTSVTKAISKLSTCQKQFRDFHMTAVKHRKYSLLAYKTVGFNYFFLSIL